MDKEKGEKGMVKGKGRKIITVGNVNGLKTITTIGRQNELKDEDKKLTEEEILEIEGVLLRERPKGEGIRVLDAKEFLTEDFEYGEFKGNDIQFEKGSKNNDIYMVINENDMRENHICKYS